LGGNLVLALAVLCAFPAGAAVVAAGAAETEFHAVGPAGFKLHGKTTELTLSDDGKVVVITVPLKQLTTGISLRDNHMREKYLEVEKFPDARLEVPWSAVKLPAAGATSEGDAQGSLTLHGQSRAVTFHYRISRDGGGGYQVSASFPMNFKEFGVNVPSYMGVTVKPDVRVETRFGAKDA
jgi:polyisoprenoid-binding protein YceI